MSGDGNIDTELALAAIAVAAAMTLGVIGYYAVRALIIGKSPILGELWALESALRRQNLPRPAEVRWERGGPLTVRWRVTSGQMGAFAEVDPRALHLGGDGETIVAQMRDGKWRLHPVVQS